MADPTNPDADPGKVALASGAAGGTAGEAPLASEAPLSERLGRRLLRHGVVLFILGLVTGRLVQSLARPRMGLASHLQGVMNGTFLVALGLVWPHLRLRALPLRAAYWLALAGTYLNWAVTLAAAAWGAGAATMPLVGGEHRGTPGQELALLAGPRALNVAMFASCLLVLWGLRGGGPPEQSAAPHAVLDPMHRKEHATTMSWPGRAVTCPVVPSRPPSPGPARSRTSSGVP